MTNKERSAGLTISSTSVEVVGFPNHPAEVDIQVGLVPHHDRLLKTCGPLGSSGRVEELASSRKTEERSHFARNNTKKAATAVRTSKDQLPTMHLGFYIRPETGSDIEHRFEEHPRFVKAPLEETS